MPMHFRSKLPWQLTLLLLLTVLPSCSTALFEPAPSAITFTCPPLVQYSKDDMTQAAKEAAAEKVKSPHLAKLINDYANLRDAVRDCQKRAAP